MQYVKIKQSIAKFVHSFRFQLVCELIREEWSAEMAYSLHSLY
jgi:hypothetical protein